MLPSLPLPELRLWTTQALHRRYIYLFDCFYFFKSRKSFTEVDSRNVFHSADHVAIKKGRRQLGKHALCNTGLISPRDDDILRDDLELYKTELSAVLVISVATICTPKAAPTLLLPSLSAIVRIFMKGRGNGSVRVKKCHDCDMQSSKHLSCKSEKLCRNYMHVCFVADSCLKRKPFCQYFLRLVCSVSISTGCSLFVQKVCCV